MKNAVRRLAERGCVAGAILIGLAATARADVQFSPLDQRLYTLPAVTATATVSAVSTGAGVSNILMVVDNLNPGWSATVDSPVVNLGAGGRTNVTLRMTPPLSAAIGDVAQFKYQAWTETTQVAEMWVTVVVGTRAPSGLALTSVNQNGLVTWTNNTAGGLYRVEWSAPGLTGRWYRSWQPLAGVESFAAGPVTGSVPVFYRVAAQAQPPPGMVLVDAGPFHMGDNYAEGDANERPVHTVDVGAFFIDRYEVSKAVWDNVRNWAAAHGYADLPAGTAGWVNGQPAPGVNVPVVSLSWYDAVKWCNARSEYEGLTPVYYTSISMTSGTVFRTDAAELTERKVRWDADGYRLPTEAEREKAARGGLDGHHFPWPSHGGAWGDWLRNVYANYADSGDLYEAGTTPIGFYNGSQDVRTAPGGLIPGPDMANGYGLYDMAGNVGEWCWDRFDNAYYGASPAADPRGPDDSALTDRALRDGSWKVGGFTLRCAQRFHSRPGDSSNDVGLRCVRQP